MVTHSPFTITGVGKIHPQLIKWQSQRARLGAAPVWCILSCLLASRKLSFLQSGLPPPSYSSKHPCELRPDASSSLGCFGENKDKEIKPKQQHLVDIPESKDRRTVWCLRHLTSKRSRQCQRMEVSHVLQFSELCGAREKQLLSLSGLKWHRSPVQQLGHLYLQGT
jgi:hypothetical protein